MVLCAKLPGHRTKDAGADRLALWIDENSGVRIEADQAAVRTTNAVCRTDDNGLQYLALLHTAARDGLFHAHDNRISDVGVAALRAAKHLDAHDAACAGVVGDV